MSRSFSTAQKLSLAGMFVGSIGCGVGLGFPDWLVSDIEEPSGFGAFLNQFVGASMGVFQICGELAGERYCEFVNVDRDGLMRWLWITRICGVACVLVSVLCGLIALCVACCGKGCRFIALGVVCFLAVGAGIAAAVIFARNTEVFTTSVLNIKLATFGWAFYLFCSCVGLLGIVSIMACFSAPENPVSGMVLGSSQAAPSIVVAQQSALQSGQQPAAAYPMGQYGAPAPANQPTGEPDYGMTNPSYRY